MVIFYITHFGFLMAGDQGQKYNVLDSCHGKRINSWNRTSKQACVKWTNVELEEKEQFRRFQSHSGHRYSTVAKALHFCNLSKQTVGGKSIENAERQQNKQLSMNKYEHAEIWQHWPVNLSQTKPKLIGQSTFRFNKTSFRKTLSPTDLQNFAKYDIIGESEGFCQ